MDRDFTIAAYIVKDSKVLLIHHRKLNMWLPPGGHIDPNELPDDTVLREVLEETGLEVSIVSDQDSYPFSDVRLLARPHHVQLELIDETTGHEHIDLVYFCQPVNGTVLLNQEETNAIRWFSSEDLLADEIVPNVRFMGLKAIDRLN
ncbi:MAG: NUDIX domain-containing protein [Candidatus Heimdallarchaeota archaeon]|nr:NUDIX domain-containing protein [Candidatus Heimdallarchaeota archaeon]MCK5048867.1 NUDIX domain-containing protein [Candidatus Heimdallarchaeota archaeon]